MPVVESITTLLTCLRQSGNIVVDSMTLTVPSITYSEGFGNIVSTISNLHKVLIDKIRIVHNKVKYLTWSLMDECDAPWD